MPSEVSMDGLHFGNGRSRSNVDYAACCKEGKVLRCVAGADFPATWPTGQFVSRAKKWGMMQSPALHVAASRKDAKGNTIPDGEVFIYARKATEAEREAFTTKKEGRKGKGMLKRAARVAIRKLKGEHTAETLRAAIVRAEAAFAAAQQHFSPAKRAEMVKAIAQAEARPELKPAVPVPTPPQNGTNGTDATKPAPAKQGKKS